MWFPKETGQLFITYLLIKIFFRYILPNKSKILISCILDLEKRFEKIWNNEFKYLARKALQRSIDEKT